MNYIFLLSFLVLVVAVPVASATELRFPDGRMAQPYQWWTQSSRMPTVDTAVIVREGQCPDRANAAACVYPDTLTIWTYPENGRRLFFHELGHIFDWQVMSDAARTAFKAIMGVEAWDQELFADAYAECALGKKAVRPAWSAYGYYVADRRTQRRVCQVIVRQGRRV